MTIRWPPPLRTLLAQFSLRVIVPLTLVMLVMIVGGVYAYQQTVTSLLVERDHQLAVLVADQLTETVAGYARVLQTLAGTPALISGALETRVRVLSQAAQTLQIFSGGVMLTDPSGQILAVSPSGPSPVGPDIAAMDYFQRGRQQLKPAFSNILIDARTGQPMILIGVPVLDEKGQFSGMLLGAVDVTNAPLGQPIDQMRIGDGGIAYVVDGQGRVIFHPEPANIGQDFTNRPFVTNVARGESGGTLWSAPTGERLVLGFTPVGGTGWGLIVREPWDSVIRPVQAYGIAMALAALATFGIVVFLLWQGVGRIAAPVRLLVRQTMRLAAGEKAEPIPTFGLAEIDTLENAFSQMATQIEAYRAGLRRYVGAITQSQEDERRRIARELHDETIQSLLIVIRRLELLQASQADLELQSSLNALQKLLTETMQGLRQMTLDLRPLMLEDLGLIAALRALVRLVREGEGAVPEARLDILGTPQNLGPERELALYRITQEALTNIRRHARATGVQVILTFESKKVTLSICDDGISFAVPESLTHLAQRGSFGLIGIQERVWAVGGYLSIQAQPGGGGTQLFVTIPVEAA